MMNIFWPLSLSDKLMHQIKKQVKAFKVVVLEALEVILRSVLLFKSIFAKFKKRI